MRAKPREKRENWLLIKGDDEYARSAEDPDILEERPESVKTGRSIDDVAGEPPGWSSKTGKIERADGDGGRQAEFRRAQARRRRIRPRSRAQSRRRMPGFVEPMLATLAKSPPGGDRWLHEIKFDGYRLQARIADGRVTLWTRGGLDWTEKFGGAVPEALLDAARAPRLARRRTGGRERKRRLRVLAACKPTSARDVATGSSTMRSIASISTGMTCAKRRWSGARSFSTG